jgi:hypothetical protein
MEVKGQISLAVGAPGFIPGAAMIRGARAEFPKRLLCERQGAEYACRMGEFPGGCRSEVTGGANAHEVSDQYEIVVVKMICRGSV